MNGHIIVSLAGEWSVTSQPLEVEGLAGYQALAGRPPDLVACVPGELHLDLMRAGRMADPSVGLNARTSCRWPEGRSWWYRTELTVPPAATRCLRQRLAFAGIDLFGQVFLNGQPLGESRNAFAPAAFDVSGILREGVNELVVRVTSGLELVPPSDEAPRLRIGGPLYRGRFLRERRYLRKPAYSFGWDWCDPLPNIGIIGDARLECRDGVSVDRLRLDPELEDGRAFLSGEIVLDNPHPWSEQAVTIRLSAVSGRGRTDRLELDAVALPGATALPCRLEVSDPELWWPNGMGPQPLYTIRAEVVGAGRVGDSASQVIGLRTLELDRSPCGAGERFRFVVNGEEVFCKGGNWAPADLIPSRVTAARYQQLVSLAREAHFTMLRVNGVGLYEHDAFYDACDRAGILVWQDFAFSCDEYPGDESFLTLVRAEAEAAIRRLRHHPCLALWCGNNEISMLMSDIWRTDPVEVSGRGSARAFNEVLPEVCARLDPGRPYWPSSPSGGASPQTPDIGDVHGWVGRTPGYVRRGAEHVGPQWRSAADDSLARFYSETFSFFAPPALGSIREYLGADELARDSEAWAVHTNAMEAGAVAEGDVAPAVPGGFVESGIRFHYGDPGDLPLEAFVTYAQLVQALLHGSAVEATRFRKGDPSDPCDGSLTWSFNETWGEVGWAIVDAYGRPRASYHAVRRAAAPLKAIVRQRGDALVTRVVNDTLEPAGPLTIRHGWARLDGAADTLRTTEATVPANGMVEVARDPVDRCQTLPGGEREWLYAVTLEGPSVRDQCVWWLPAFRELSVERDPAIAVERAGSMLRVSSPVFCHGVHLADAAGERLGDEFFDLLPGVPLLVPLADAEGSRVPHLRAVTPIER
ncbi:MAG: hypothetical protein U0R50_00555 [Gaiellales bacterium]